MIEAAILENPVPFNENISQLRQRTVLFIMDKDCPSSEELQGSVNGSCAPSQ